LGTQNLKAFIVLLLFKLNVKYCSETVDSGINVLNDGYAEKNGEVVCPNDEYDQK
jgi:hypothetical protein